MTDIALYKSFDVWQQVDDKTVVRYRCFEVVGKGKYCVQSSDYFYNSPDGIRLYESDKQHIELFMEEAPDKRSKTYTTIQEAILRHIDEFSENP